MERRPIVYTQVLSVYHEHGAEVAIDLYLEHGIGGGGKFVLRVDDVEKSKRPLPMSELSSVEKFVVMGLCVNEIVGKTAEALAHYLYWQVVIMRDEQLDFLRPVPDVRKWAAEQRLWMMCSPLDQYDVSRAVRDYGEVSPADVLLALGRQLRDPVFLAALQAAVIAGRGLAFLSQQNWQTGEPIVL